MVSRVFASHPNSSLPLSLKILRILLALSLALTTLCAGLLSTTNAQAATPAYLDSVLGPLHIRVQWNLQDHEQDYIGTPYVEWTESDGDLDKEEGPWWSQGIPSSTGAVGMNDAGFIAHVIMQTGYSMNSFATMNAWFDNNSGTSGTKRTGRWANVDTLFDILKAKAIYRTFSSKEELLKSDYLQKCDIIIMKCDGTDSGGTDDFGRHHDCAHKSHVGIFYGEDSDDDVLWHSNDSYYGFRADEILTGNNLSRIQPSCWGSTYYVFKWQELGRVFLWRTPTNTELVRSNSSYSFYDCWHNSSYKSDMSVKSGVFPTHNITTDEQRYLAPSTVSGCAMPGVPTVGDLWMQGYTPGKGYVLDTTIYHANVKRYNSGPDQVTNIYTLVKPKYNPLSEVVSTYDADRKPAGNAAAQPSGNATLQGAQFRVRFYDCQAESYDEVKNRAPRRQWIFQTDPTGKVTLTSESSTFTVTEPSGLKQSLNYQLSGNALFTQNDGTPILSLGTYLITPYKASEGYQFEDESAYSLQQIDDTSYDVEVVNLFEAPSFAQSVIRGGVHISVQDADYIDKNHLTGLAGAQYEIRNDSTEAVVVDGRTYQPGETVATITTNDIGYASTATDALPYGTYSIKQTKAYSGGTIGDASWTRFEVGSNNELTNPYVRAAVPTPVYGGVHIAVLDAQTGEPTPQGDGSFEDIAFEITNASESAVTINGAAFESGALIDTLHTNATGVAETSTTALARGTYMITPKNAPLGYTFTNAEARTFTIEENDTLVDPFADHPFTLDAIRGGITFERRDSENNTTTPQGSALLSGATYAITNESTQSVLVDGTLYNPGEVVATLTTDNNGASTFADTLPYGTYAISEATPSSGYYLSNEQKQVHIREQGLMNTDFTGAAAFRATVIKGGISGSLFDAETLCAQPLGRACIAGAQFSVINTSAYPVWVQGVKIGVGEPCLALTTDYNGTVQSSVDSLPVGSYTLKLTSAPKGYERASESTWNFDICAEGYTSVTASDGGAVCLPVIRGDITLTKTSEDGPLANVPYRITSKTTGESHIVVTDEQGIASTSADHARHSESTNANDSADSDTYATYAGVWFGAYNGGSTAPNDARGALPYDAYLVEELPCPANEGCELDVIDNVSINEPTSPQISLTHPQATVTTYPSLETSPTDASGGILPYAPGQSELPATVRYDGLVPGQEYVVTIRPQILVTSDDGTVSATPVCDQNGNPLTITHSFTPDTPSGSFTVMIPTSGADLSQATVVFFDELATSADPSTPLISHTNAAVLPGVVVSTKPLISTKASESSTGAKTLWCASEISLTDMVGYYNLTPGTTYEIRTSALVKDPTTGESHELTDASGTILTTSQTFTPESPQGILTTTLSLDTTELAGYEVVVCETITLEGVPIAIHNDLQDPAQTLSVSAPTIKGSVVDTSDNNHTLSPSIATTVRDSITYAGLVPGNEYTIRATAMIKGASAGDGGEEVVPLIQDDQPIQGEITFIPETSNGTLDLTLTLSSESLAGSTLVIYEDLLSAGETITANHNPTSANHTLTVATRSFHTTARDAYDKDAVLNVGSEQKAVVTTEYRGLVPGDMYSVLTIAMDAHSGLPYQNALTARDYSDNIEACWNDLTAALHIQTETDNLTKFTNTLEAYFGMEPSLAWNQTSFEASAADGCIPCEVPITTSNAPQSTLSFYVYIFHHANNLLASFENVEDPELLVHIERPILQAAYTDAYDLDRCLVAEQERSLQCTLDWRYLEPAEGYTLATIALDPARNLPVDTAEDHTQRSGRVMNAHLGSKTAWNLLCPDPTDTEITPLCTLEDIQQALSSQAEPTSQAWVFTPLSVSNPSDTQNITVSFDASSLEGKHVAFATYLFNAEGAVCAFDTTAHEALPSFEVLAPSITTNVKTTSEDTKTFTMSADTKFSNTIHFNNLGANLTYTLLTIIVDQRTGLPARTISNPEDAIETNEPINWSLLTALRNDVAASEASTQLAKARIVAESLNAQAGTTVCFESAFTPETESGFIQPEFSLNTIGLQNDSFVVYEYIFAPDGSLRTAHSDLEDGGSALYLTRPLLTSIATDSNDGDHVVRPTVDAHITNTVTFRGLEPNATYEVVGTLMNKTGQSTLTIDGLIVEQSVSFTPETSDGTITLDIGFDGSSLDDQDLVLFNTLYRDGKVVTSCRDYESTSQSILVRKTGSALPPVPDDPNTGDVPSGNPPDDPNNQGSSGNNNQTGNNPNDGSGSGSGNQSGNNQGNASGNSSGNASGNQSGNSSGNSSGNNSGNNGSGSGNNGSGDNGSNNAPGQGSNNAQKNPNAYLSATTNNPEGPTSPDSNGQTPQDSPASSQNQNDNPGYKAGYYAKTGRNLTILLIGFGVCSAGCAIAFAIGMRSVRKNRMHHN